MSDAATLQLSRQEQDAQLQKKARKATTGRIVPEMSKVASAPAVNSTATDPPPPVIDHAATSQAILRALRSIQGELALPPKELKEVRAMVCPAVRHTDHSTALIIGLLIVGALAFVAGRAFKDART